MAEEIEIAEYDRRWPARFAAEARQIRRLLGAPFLEIEHHGSTAVPGLAAKPVIDMLVAADSIASAERYATTLVQNGYERVDPRYREIWPERIVLIRRDRGARVCHVHLMLRRHAAWTRLIAFRDHLRAHPEVAREYADLKRSLAATLGHDRHAYMIAKGDFIARITDIAMRRPAPSAADTARYNGPMNGSRLSRTFPARRDALPQVEGFLAEVCAGAGLGREACLRLTLLVEELFTNTVVHGHGADSDAPVLLDFEVAAGRIVLVYEDTAPPHDPFAVVDAPDSDARVEDRLVGGLGVLLVSAMAQQVEYRRAGDRNRISLVIDAVVRG